MIFWKLGMSVLGLGFEFALELEDVRIFKFDVSEF